MPCRTLGTYGACTGRSRSLWCMDRGCFDKLTTLELIIYIEHSLLRFRNLNYVLLEHQSY
ncbi:hypothetical protein HanIR_Chr16g0793041 [Helianthus annuus]|nr:hypothetical protein HanIR_Chr16g0793041 [Helianthus annuus]